MKDKTMVLVMSVFTILIPVCGIGYYIGITMVDELENHPEITEIGAPPKLEYLAAIVLVAALMLVIVLKLNPPKDDEETLCNNKLKIH